MNRIDLTRRQFINLAVASSGLFAMSGASDLVLGEDSEDLGLGELPPLEDGIPYPGITDEEPQAISIREQDPVFKGHPNGDRLILPKKSSEKYSDLVVKFAVDATCGRYDLAFLF